MIKRLKYLHGSGHRPGSDYPKQILVAVSVGSSQVTEGILRAFNSEQIGELSGVYGDRDAGDPVEVDKLEIETVQENVSVTVFNRGIALRFTDSEEIHRLHRFFGVIERELAALS